MSTKGKIDTFGCWPTVEIVGEHIKIYNNSSTGGFGRVYNKSETENLEGLLIKVLDDYVEPRQKIHIEMFIETLKRIDDKDPTFVLIDGTPYTIANEHSKSAFRGFGGRKFCIEFFDGRVVTTTNLWQGTPFGDLIRTYLKDNAKFVKQEE